MTKLSKYVATALVCGAILTTVATINTNQTVVHADSIGTVANKEITSLRQNVAKSDMFLSYLDYENGDHATIAEDLKSTIEVVDQDGEVVDHDLLDWSFKFFRMGWNASELSHTHQYDWSMQNRIYNGNKTGDYGILVPTITLKSNPEVTNTRNQSLNSDWRPQISMGNRVPVINIEESERIIRMQEGDTEFRYDGLEGVTWSDYEDDIRDLEMAVSYTIPAEDNKWSELPSGTRNILIRVTDSDGATTTAQKIVNVRRTNPPKITPNERQTVTATKGSFDYSQLFEVTDELDDNPVVTIDDSKTDLTKTGRTSVKVTATNRYGKEDTQTIGFDVVRDTITLEAEDFTVDNSNFEQGKTIAEYVKERVSAYDEFEGDITNLITINPNRDLDHENDELLNGDYDVFVTVNVEGSEPKQEWIVVTVDVPYFAEIDLEAITLNLNDTKAYKELVNEDNLKSRVTTSKRKYNYEFDNDININEVGDYYLSIRVRGQNGIFSEYKAVRVHVVDETPVVPTPEPNEPEVPVTPEVPDTDGEEPVVPTPEPDTDGNDNDSEVPDTEEPDTDSDGEEPDTDNNETPVDTDNNDSDGSDNNTEEPVEEVEDTEKGEDELLVANSNNPVTTAVLTALGISTTTLAYLFNPFKKKEEKE